MIMKHSGKLQVSTRGDRELHFRREFDAPRALVFDAYTQPELIKRWFHGPPGWMLVTCEFEARVGGRYRYVWRKEDGTEMGMGGEIREVMRPERLVVTEKFDQAWYPGDAYSTLVLTEHGGKTTLELTVTYASKQALEAVLKTPAADGVAVTFDSLEQFLTVLAKEVG